MHLLKWQNLVICFLKPNPWTSCIAHYQNAMAWGNISTWNKNSWFVRSRFTFEKRGKQSTQTWATNFQLWWHPESDHLIGQDSSPSGQTTAQLPPSFSQHTLRHAFTSLWSCIILFLQHTPHIHTGAALAASPEFSTSDNCTKASLGQIPSPCHTNICLLYSISGDIETEE